MILAALIIFAAAASPDPLNVQQYSAQSENAALYVLPGASLSTPDIVILDETTLTVYRGSLQSPTISHTIPPNTLLFDLFDTNDDDVPELFILTPDEIRHYPFANNQTTVQLFPILPPLPWIVEQPFLHPLVFHFNGAHLVAVPYQDNITLKNFDGKTVSTLPKIRSDLHSLFSIPIVPNQLASKGAFEFRVDTLLTTPVTVPQELRLAQASTPFASVTPRQLRDSEQLELDLWPSFPLTPSPDDSLKVIYASHAPEYIHTVIRIKKKLPRNIPSTTEPYRFSPKRIYPGTIGISESGFPDFNNDGFHDLLLWKIPIPGHSLGSLINSIRAQTWPIEISTHLYNPEKGLYEARPDSRIKTTIALQYILTRQNRSPLNNLTFPDLNNDGNSDIVFSSRPDQLDVWMYRRKLPDSPDYTAQFDGPVSLITINRPETPGQSRSILLRGKRSIYRVNLAEEAQR
jgi:hypothetical protein